ncbi:hypothetical protein SPRG_18914 [Saprolegnia parasitica CBS 223.65]|uniref:Histidine acid phosphatase n=1 Tax=Saprolegnia parasitica (strain CBS 223.65) TaxID=695850 RepID=A0A067D2S0_SAPPC|nr:hypothetical protein SPRG_18914 [Saprolegnia parasitica CBS 223.65]KDO35780.1 hypothetical protein SPRG_18914 [Saprolegnia parasitica CBS 223.65]|eukprot:XP_012194124.1 hypothetical protein SPRG_18914 [Saprolegnia parasitica CBS 223.65]
MRLRLVQVLHRHGDRSPLHNVFAGVPWRASKEDALWAPKLHAPSTGVYGQLTTLGVDQMRARGAQLRDQCLSQGWTLRDELMDLKVLSTPYDRTQQSVLALLSRLAPHAATMNDVHVLPRHLNFINAYSANGDVIIPLKMQLIADHPEYAKDDARVEPLKQELVHRLPMFREGGEAFTWMKAADHFICRDAHALEYLPETKELAKPTIDHLSLRFQQYYTDPVILRLVATGLVTELLDQMEQSMAGGATHVKEAIRIYSGHDVSLLALLYALDTSLVQPFWPDYSAAVVLELHQDGTDWLVRVTLDNEVVVPLMPFPVFASALRQKTTH